MKKIILKVIKFYQKVFSPGTGLLGFLYPEISCKFYPSCSHYAYSAIFKYGLLKGLLKGGWRLLRCHPWSQGGIDEV